ncbi:MAG: 7-cyano-7-deazaguanine synthase QueC [Mycobacterium kyogaense]|uniref:7-cyano-7-deazaguanine synthase QueC n=1 Tax=Mycobacterium kyogaense TaxID=2212479 RepID=UPI002FF6B6D1
MLLSGGMDSAVTCAVARRDSDAVHCLTFDYGQRHASEIDAARLIVRALNVDSHVVTSLPIGDFGGSVLTDKAIAIPEAQAGGSESGIPATYVPCRNLVFLSIASAFAEARNCMRIYIGTNAIDYSGYPDCRPEFIDAFQAALNLGSKAGAKYGSAPRVIAPLTSLSKSDIVILARRLGVDLKETVSCYDAADDGAACGRCDACQLRRAGFVEAGLADPTRYWTDKH